jgi:hypothetical protein
LDEAVLGQGVDGFAVEVGQLALGFRNQSQRLRSSLPERAFEPRLLAQRLVAPAPR